MSQHTRLPDEKPVEFERFKEWASLPAADRPKPSHPKLALKYKWAERARAADTENEVSLIGADQKMRDIALEVELRQLERILCESRDGTLKMSPRDLSAWHTMTDALIERAKGRGQERGVVDLSDVLSEEQLLKLKAMKAAAKIA